MSRPVPPSLEFPTPPCSICGEDTEYDDGFHCPYCEAYWSKDGAPEGEWYAPKAEQCRSVLRPWEDRPEYPTIQDTEYRCFLEEGHRELDRGAVLHRHPEEYGGWKDTDKHVYEVTE